MKSIIKEMNRLAQKKTGTDPKINDMSNVINYMSEHMTGTDPKKQTIAEALKYYVDNYVSGGGTDTSDATMEASDILSGKTGYARGMKLTGTYVPLDTSDATATETDIQVGKTAYVNGVKITGTRSVGDVFENLGYTETPISISGYSYAKNIYDNWDASITNMSGYYEGKSDDMYIYPMVDTSNVINFSNTFNGCVNLGTLPTLDTSSATNMSGMFFGCSHLEKIPLFSTSSVTDMSSMFSGCYSLTSIPLFDTSNATNMNQMFFGCDLLTNESLNNILAMCANSAVTSNKTLENIGLSSAQATICQGLSNYQDFIDAGWTTGY